MFGLAVYLPDSKLWIMPATSALFTFGRTCFYFGYHMNVLYRAPGFGMGMFPSIVSLLFCAYKVVMDMFGKA